MRNLLTATIIMAAAIVLVLLQVSVQGTRAAGVTCPDQPNLIEVGSKSREPHMFDLAGGVEYTPCALITVGDEVPLLEGEFPNFTTHPTKTIAFMGVPDGMGYHETEDAYFVTVQHEIDSGELPFKVSSQSDDVIDGARVTIFQFDKQWNLIGGRNLIENVVDVALNDTFTLNLENGNYENASGDVLNNGGNFDRFCSGSGVSDGFVDASGNPTYVHFAPDEGEIEPRGYVIFMDGTAYSLDRLGKYRREQVLSAAQYRVGSPLGKTVLFSTEDNATGNGEVYMYVGEQTVDDPNGFFNGQLYVMKVVSLDPVLGTEIYHQDESTIPEDTEIIARWTPVDLAITLGSSTGLQAWANANERATGFQRVEDIHEDPNALGTFYFTVTGNGNFDQPTNQQANLFGKLHRFTLDINDPTADGIFINHMTGDFALNPVAANGTSYDNLAIDSYSRIIIQEDKANPILPTFDLQGRDARVLVYDVETDSAEFWFEINESALDNGIQRGEWESSGIIEVDANADFPEVGLPTLLLNVQAHNLPSIDYDELGQMLLMVPSAIDFPPQTTPTAVGIAGLSAGSSRVLVVVVALFGLALTGLTWRIAKK